MEKAYSLKGLPSLCVHWKGEFNLRMRSQLSKNSLFKKIWYQALVLKYLPMETSEPDLRIASKRGLNCFEKKIHLLMSRNAGDDEPKMAPAGCSRVIGKRWINTVSN